MPSTTCVILRSATGERRERLSKDAKRRCSVGLRCLRALERDLLVRAGIGKCRDQAEAGLADPRAEAVDERQLPDRRVDRLLVKQLLDLFEDRRALLLIEFDRLLLKQLVDIRVVAVSVGAALDHIGLQASRRVAERAAAALDDVLQLFVAVRLKERRPLERPQMG